MPRNTTAHITVTPTVQHSSRPRGQLLHHAATQVNLPNQPPVLSTCSSVQANQQKLVAATSTAPNQATRIPIPKLKPPLPLRRSSHRQQANAVVVFVQVTTTKPSSVSRSKSTKLLQSWMKNQAANSSIVNFCASPKYKKEWSRSAANKFGRLAQGVGN